jgi:septal ring factor EnvC (AmiA/AmiB activator)
MPCWIRIASAAICLTTIALTAGHAGHAQAPAPPATPAKPVAAPKAAPKTAQSASAIRDRLRLLKAESDGLLKQQQTLLVELRRLDLDRQMKAAQIEETESTIGGLEVSLADKQSRIAQTEAALAAAKPAIRDRILRIHKLGRLGYSRLLLDMKDVRTFRRTARVASLLARRDHEQLDRHNTLITTLKLERARLDADRKAAEELRARLVKEQQALGHAIAAQGARVKEIEERRDLNEQLARELVAAQERLSASVTRLTPTPGLPGARATAGRYEWPLAGAIQTRFGRQQSSRFGTEIARNGIEIAAEAGSAVKAIDAGKVAYADIFSGFGQLVILDHGQKTYSLYGHLSAMAVQRGGTVERGQTVGSSGATPTGVPAVYFELRIDGKPVDPVQWLKP